MEKSIFNKDYSILLSLLRRSRKSVGLTQGQVAVRLGQTQSFVSKCERGERRIDVIELRAFCQALGIPLTTFMHNLEGELQRGAGSE